MEAEAKRQPAAGAPAPGGVQDPDRRAEQHGEEQVGREPDPLEQRAGHDRRGRPGEQQEGKEEDEVDVVRQVRPEGVRPGDAALAGDAGEVRAVGADPRDPGLVAVVDPPAEVVEARRDDGDREDVLHRRRQRVLAARDAGLVGHEADVDQPHDHDREEVEGLAEDQAVEGLRLDRGRFLQGFDLSQKGLDLGNQEVAHPRSLLGPGGGMRALNETSGKATSGPKHIRIGSPATMGNSHIFPAP